MIVMSRHSLIPDSTFYICFLDDIEKPEFLIRIIENEKFHIFTGRVIKDEIKRSPNYQFLEQQITTRIKLFNYYLYGEILRPFFSQEEIKKGEHEVIVISFIMYSEDNNFTAILDDGGPRKFLEKNFPNISKLVEGTVGFTKNCYIKHNIFTQGETLIILDLIQKSKFRIGDEIISNVMSEVRCN